ncbi:hypothetical protein D3C72_1772680 [compost metagenome]
MGAGGGEAGGNRAAKALRAAGDQRDAAIERKWGRRDCGGNRHAATIPQRSSPKNTPAWRRGSLIRQRISLPVDETIDISTNDEPVWRVGL